MQFRALSPLFSTRLALAAGAGCIALIAATLLWGGGLGPSLNVAPTGGDAASVETAWPWAPASSKEAHRDVRRLGFSAVLSGGDTIDRTALAAIEREIDHGGDARVKQTASKVSEAQDPHLLPEDVSVGDRITVVTADGLSHVYRVTGREIAEQPVDREAAPKVSATSCENMTTLAAGAWRLVIEAVQAGEKKHTPEQKL